MRHQMKFIKSKIKYRYTNTCDGNNTMKYIG